MFLRPLVDLPIFFPDSPKPPSNLSLIVFTTALPVACGHSQGAGDVVYGVELVSINFNVNPSDKRDNFYTDDACDAAAFAAGNASGKCPT